MIAFLAGTPAILAAEEAVKASDGGFFAQHAWVMILAPFLAFLLIILFGKRLPLLGAEIAIAAIGVSFVWGTVLWVTNVVQGVVYERSFEIAPFGSGFGLEWGWVVDGLSSMMFFVVGLVAFLVFVYAVGYMRGDVRVTFFFAALSLFAGAMLVLVSAPNLVQLIVGWEGVGVASYLLIGHYWEKRENSSAAIKAFLTNKVADVGLIIGTFVLGVAVGSFTISEILTAAEEGASGLSAVAVAGALLLFFGAMGKSAQFPLHVWLPDAMAGPTPVSALMHAATMVTAGIYLVARMFPLYEGLAHDAAPYVMWIGAITLLLAGLLAIVQDDIKKVLAYSTVSQLGYMAAALGAGGYTAGLFHLFTHAFFKALLFLGAGSVIHAVHSNSMKDMGGLRKHMPITYWTFVIGSLALAGIPPFAGFFSKDEILATFNHGGYQAVLLIGVLGAFITAFYMARTVFLTFHGEYKGHGHPHESEPVMTTPLIVLATLSVVGGFVNVPGVFTGFARWVTTRAHTIHEYHPESFDLVALGMGLAAGLAGIIIGYLVYYPDAETQEARDRIRIPVLWPLLERKYFLDDLYMYGIVYPIRGPIAAFVNWINDYVIDGIVNVVGFATKGLGKVVYEIVDQPLLDNVYNGAAFLAGAIGSAFRRIQTGKVQQYAASIVGSVVLLVLGFLIFR